MYNLIRLLHLVFWKNGREQWLLKHLKDEFQNAASARKVLKMYYVEYASSIPIEIAMEVFMVMLVFEHFNM